MQTNKTYYQLTYFDTNESVRKKYLNGSSWENIDGAIYEFKLIMTAIVKKQARGIVPTRIKWRLESITNKKRGIVKYLK